MDPIDRNLLAAWVRVSEQLRRDPVLAAKRIARARRVTVANPLRAWCLALRASDTRLTEHYNAYVNEEAVQDAQEHEVTITGEAVRLLCAPVTIPWPGMPMKSAGDKLGVCERVIHQWVRRGKLEVAYESSRIHGYHGKPRPVVWSSGPLNPGALEGEPPDAVWGTLWQHMADDFPLEFLQTIRRVARWRTPSRRERGAGQEGEGLFAGWAWLCPGRPDGRGGRIPCSRRCRWLYCPRPVWTLAKHLGQEMPIAMPALDPAACFFACADCWRVVRPFVASPRASWNAFVTHITAGLLTGREVERPPGVCENAPRKIQGRLEPPRLPNKAGVLARQALRIKAYREWQERKMRENFPGRMPLR